MSNSGPGAGRDSRVDAYIAAMAPWQARVAAELRELIHSVDAQMGETIKRTALPYFVLEGNVCALLATRDHLNLFLYDGAIVPDPAHIVTGGHGNSTARTVAFFENDPIPAAPLVAMLTQIVANNRAGGWRAIKNS